MVKVTSLRGFNVRRGPNGVYGIDIIQEPDDPYYIGTAPSGTHEFTIRLDKISKVVGVFDDRRMMDLGILDIAKKAYKIQNRAVGGICEQLQNQGLYTSPSRVEVKKWLYI
ncbi:hypothetical protein ASPWEDRAFT_39172, partial [Aspergillus wentii DTO 134E9]